MKHVYQFSIDAWKNNNEIYNGKSFIMLCGLPGSGKSTFVNKIINNGIKEHNLNKDSFVVVSSDEIRYSMFDEYNVKDNTKVFNEAHRRIIQALNKNKIVIFDATNLSGKRRASLIQEIEKNVDFSYRVNKVCFIMATPIDECIKRNKKRDRIVPESDILRMWKQIEIPNLYYELYNNVYIVYPHEKYLLKPIFNLYIDEEFLNFNQDNPNHKYNLAQHCYECCKELEKSKSNVWCYEFMKEVALLHDIGKMFTKTYTDYKGNHSDIAHYYGHEHVSAYESLFYQAMMESGVEFKSTMLDRANIIDWHMKPYCMDKDKIKGKIKHPWFVESLYIFHEADKIAH